MGIQGEGVAQLTLQEQEWAVSPRHWAVAMLRGGPTMNGSVRVVAGVSFHEGAKTVGGVSAAREMRSLGVYTSHPRKE